MKPNHCGRCGEEVRHGVRNGVTAWWHREEVNHRAALGRVLTPEEWAENDRQYRERVFYDDDGKPYTAAEADIMRDKDADRRRRRLAELRGEDPDYVEPLPPVEVWSHDIDPKDFPPTSGVRQIVNLVTGVTKAGKKKSDPPAAPGWELHSLTHARGPYIGSSGESLSISDSVVLRSRGPEELDGTRRVAVASWRDGKFDFAYIGILKDHVISPRKVNATEMKDWIKGLDAPNPSDSND